MVNPHCVSTTLALHGSEHPSILTKMLLFLPSPSESFGFKLSVQWYANRDLFSAFTGPQVGIAACFLSQSSDAMMPIVLSPSHDPFGTPRRCAEGFLHACGRAHLGGGIAVRGQEVSRGRLRKIGYFHQCSSSVHARKNTRFRTTPTLMCALYCETLMAKIHISFID